MNRPTKTFVFVGRLTAIVASVAMFWMTAGSAVAPAQAPSPSAVKSNITYQDARPILEELRQDLLPAELRNLSRAQRESVWPGWVTRRDTEIRLRLERGDEDSLVNLLLFGVTFTQAPRVSEQDISNMTAGQTAPAAIQARIEDLAWAVAAPGDNERLQFVREVFRRHSIDPGTTAGRDQVRRRLNEGVNGVVEEYKSRLDLVRSELLRRRDPAVIAVEQSTVFRDRGLSSDTTLFPGSGIEEALSALKSDKLLAPGSVHRVAVVGPGLDFADKRDGYDFYPPQTIQPFAVIDSLIRLDLAAPNDFRLTTFDLSTRINHHLETARERARAGTGYVLQLPRNTERFAWTLFLVKYWERFGDKIGKEETPVPVPPGSRNVAVRAVRVRPDVVMSIAPEDVNIVLQRMEPLAAGERFDLIIATNILLYYDSFEQSLAVANAAKMLRPAGLLLTNTAVPLLPSIPIDQVGHTDVSYTNRPDEDRLFWYQRH